MTTMNDITALMATMKPGKYAILYRDNWDGEGDTYHCLASLSADGKWHDEEFNAELLQYEGDEILKAWPLDDGSNVLALVEALEKAQESEKQWREVVDAFCTDDADWHKLTNSNNELISLLSQALCKQADRISSLESRTVTVKLPKLYGMDFCDRIVPDSSNGFLFYSEQVVEMLAAAGIQVIEGDA